MICDYCYEDAEHRVYPDDSAEFPAGPAIKLCHTAAGTYVHVLEASEE